MQARKIDHVGVIVEDLDAAKAFFVELGLEAQWQGDMSGELVDRVVALENAHSTVVFMRVPNSQTGIELIKFHAPVDTSGVKPIAANTLGIRHIAFVVNDIEEMVTRLKAQGTELFSEVQTFEDVYKLCYVRGPEGMIIELAEELG